MHPRLTDQIPGPKVTEPTLFDSTSNEAARVAARFAVHRYVQILAYLQEKPGCLFEIAAALSTPQKPVHDHQISGRFTEMMERKLWQRWMGRCLWCGETHRVPSKLLEVGAGLAHIALERERQIAKGFDAAHDDQHTDQSILHAAGWIINDLEDRATHESDADPDDVADSSWPERLAVHVREKYGDDKIKRLAIAGALIVAEMERLIRGKVVGS